MRLLVTRPEPDNARTAAMLRARGCEVLLAPLLQMQTLDFDPGEGPWDALALTSVNAVRALAAHSGLHRLATTPAYAVGRRTADAAREIGFGRVVSADGDAGRLAHLIRQHRSAGARLLYLAGEDRARDLAAELAETGIAVTTCVVYRAKAVSELPRVGHDALATGRIDGVLHFSRRSAAIYVDCTKAAGLLDKALMPVQFCLSQAVAEPLTAAGAVRVLIARQPREADLLDLVTV